MATTIIHHHLLHYGDLGAKEKMPLAEHEFECEDDEYSKPANNRGQVAGWQAGGQYLVTPKNIHSMAKQSHDE